MCICLALRPIPPLPKTERIELHPPEWIVRIRCRCCRQETLHVSVTALVFRDLFNFCKRYVFTYSRVTGISAIIETERKGTNSFSCPEGLEQPHQLLTAEESETGLSDINDPALQPPNRRRGGPPERDQYNF